MSRSNLTAKPSPMKFFSKSKTPSARATPPSTPAPSQPSHPDDDPSPATAARATGLYTRTGDRGTTSLPESGQLHKDAQRLQAIGDVDELNSALGLVTSFCIDDDLKTWVAEIQHRLLDLGAELAQPSKPRIISPYTARLEQLIDRLDANLPPQRHFILPGGTAPAAQCHMARSLCRRAERSLVRLSRTEQVNTASLQFMNRLSDLLLVLARTLNRRAGEADIPWQPGGR